MIGWAVDRENQPKAAMPIHAMAVVRVCVPWCLIDKPALRANPGDRDRQGGPRDPHQIASLVFGATAIYPYRLTRPFWT